MSSVNPRGYLADGSPCQCTCHTQGGIVHFLPCCQLVRPGGGPPPTVPRNLTPVSLEGIQVGEVVEHRDGVIGTVKRVEPGAGFSIGVMVGWGPHRWLKRDGTGEVPSQDVVKRLGVKETPDPVPSPICTSLEAVLEEVREERLYQDRQHGGPAHDDTHLRGDWQEFIDDRLPLYDPELMEDEEYRQSMLEIAALAIAAIQSLDRKVAKRAADAYPVP